MERTKNVNAEKEEKPLWKKVGGGSLRIGKRIIKPGQVFEAYPNEISKSFRDQVIPMGGNDGEWTDNVKSKEAPPLLKGIKSVYTLQPRGGSKLWWDIVDVEGKVLNEKALKKEVGEKLIEDMQR